MAAPVPGQLDPNADVNLDELIADASDSMDELLKAPEPSSKVATLDLEQPEATAPAEPAPSAAPLRR